VRIVVCLNATGGSGPAMLASGDQPAIAIGDQLMLAYGDQSMLAYGDQRALALALAVPGDRQVIAVFAGSVEEAAPLQAALAAGADRAARIPGQSSSSTDFHTQGKSLASAATSLRADLVLAGARADAEALGAVSAVVARQMRIPHLANVETLELLGPAADQRLAVTVRGAGWKRRLAVQLPAVLSIAGPPTKLPAAAARTTAPPAIEVLAPIDPEATVLRRRTEILGASTAVTRETKTVASAAELIAGLTRR
jgi:electron transfer flavoprotein alpha/beta subunit